jgi:copper(I)-binding protein
MHLIRCLLAWCALLSAFVALPSSAHDYTKESLHIAHPWSRATPRGASVGAGYLTIENRGALADRFVSVSISQELAGRAEIHEMAVHDGVMRMRPLPHGIEIAPGMAARLEPGGLHVMFLDLRRPLEKGDRFKATLRFERAGDVEVEFVVEAMGGEPEHRGH